MTAPTESTLWGGGAATLSDDGIYRYDLTRDWSPGRRVLWIMLNPSTADAEADDPTIRRCIDFSRSWGFGGLVVCNLFALRATDPRELRDHADPVGPGNDEAIRLHAGRDDVDRVVCAWGNHGELRGRWGAVGALALGRLLFCLGVTKSGQPRHPLYLPAVTPLVRWDAA